MSGRPGATVIWFLRPGNDQESAAYGIGLGPPRERSDRLEEACQVLAGLLSPQPAATFTGDPAQTAADAAAFAAAGARLAIVYLPPPYIPGVLEPLACALSELDKIL